MTETATSMRVNDGARTVKDARQIPPLSHREAAAIATVELERVLALVEELRPDEWTKPTACTRWDVRQIVAHLVAEADICSNFAQFRRLGQVRLYGPYRAAGMSQLDAMNQLTVDDRADLTTAQLVAQLRERGPRAIRTRERMPALLRHLPLPLGKVTPELGRTWVSIGYLTDTILPRDTWMHRLDISRATGRTMVLSPEHDGRLTALAVRELVFSLAPRLERAVTYHLTGCAGGTWKIGRGESAAELVMDTVDFQLLASGRLSPEEARLTSIVSIEGDAELVSGVIDQTSVPY